MTVTAAFRRGGESKLDPEPQGVEPVAAPDRRVQVPTEPRQTPEMAIFALAVVLAAGELLMLSNHGRLISGAVAVAIAALLVVRGVRLGRPVTLPHAVAGIAALALSFVAQREGLHTIGVVGLALAGLLLMLPTRSRPHPELMPAISLLVDRTAGDPLAPFALHSAKSYFIESDGMAAVGYRTRAGIAVIGGDPVGDVVAFPRLAAQFVAYCRERGWRIAVLGAGERGRELWSAVRGAGRLRAVPFGRDVVLDMESFALEGRRFRNLRQAVNRAQNAGVSAEIVAETDLSAAERADLYDVAVHSPRGVGHRGFSMIMDHLLDGRTPGLLLVVARDAQHRAIAFQRYGVADHGREISLDRGWRRPEAPNGIDERMTMAMVEWGRSHGARRISLSFAAFPDLFDNQARTVRQRVGYRLIHLGDPLIAVESLYIYLRKFHALDGRRYAMLGLPYALFAVFALLTLEFVPNHREF